MRAELFAMVLVLVASVAPRAIAQDEDPIERGRALYLEGLAAFEEGRFEDAERSFRASYELSHVPVALHNVATSLRSLGRYAEALRAARALLDDHPDLDPEVREATLVLVRELRAQVAVLTLLDLPVAPSLALRLDGAPRALSDARPVELELDAGPHRLRVEMDGRLPFDWEGSVDAGDRVRVDVRLAEPDAARASDDSWIWILTAVAIGVAVAAGVGIGVGLYVAGQGGSEYDDHIQI